MHSADHNQKKLMTLAGTIAEGLTEIYALDVEFP
jgi:hypothetical protein